MSVSVDSPAQKSAVIDVGSNSVRLVLYAIEGRAIWQVFNEKVLAGLGRDLSTTGELSPPGVATALPALARFSALIRANRPDRLFCVATAAVREASDGAAFARRVREETGLEMRILSGPEEARLSALGVMGGAPGSQGIAADLGGGSLELARLENGAPTKGVSLPLGPLRLTGRGRADLALARAEALRVLAGTERAYRAEALNAVGGGWRNLALIHMKMTDYPLGIVHQYEMTRSQALDVARFAMRQSRSSLERIEGISKRRVETLPHAALVLETLIEHLKIERVVISAWGLREGLILEAMDPALRARDPLIEGCAALTARQEFEGGAARELAFALEAWLSAPFARLPAAFGARDSALIAAACELADLGIRLHPDHRADLVFDQVLRAPIAGMDHAERAFLACAAFSRHSARPETPEPQLVQRLLGPARLERARALGAAVRLACELSGRIPALLAHASLAIKPASVVLHIEGAWGPMLGGDQIERRAAQLAGRLGRGLKIRTGPAEAGAKAAAGRAAKRSKVFRAA